MMMCLNNIEVKKLVEQQDLRISPFEEKNLNHSGYEIRLGNRFLRIYDFKINKKSFNIFKFRKFEEGISLKPRSFLLGISLEEIGIASSYIAFLKARNYFLSLDYVIHATHGFIEQEELSPISITIFNSSKKEIRMYPGMKIAEVVFVKRTVHS